MRRSLIEKILEFKLKTFEEIDFSKSITHYSKVEIFQGELLSQSYCPIPWMFQAVRNNGDYRLCCQANVTKTQGILKDSQGNNMNVLNTSSSQARNADLMKTTRLEMLAGTWPEECGRCQKEESSGLRSRRVYENQAWGERFSLDWAKSITQNDGSIAPETPLVYMDIRFGNKCNLKCRMCGPTDSDLWYQDHYETYGSTFKDTQGTVEILQNEGKYKVSDEGYTWYERSHQFWADLKKNIGDIEHIHIVGGEPLLIRAHQQFLQDLVDSGHATQVTLEYNTNLTLLPEAILELWKKFKKVRIGVSLDGVGEVNEYIRYPSKWSLIEKNLKKLNSQGKPFELWISSTIQIYNIFHLPQIILWKLKSGLNNFNVSKRQPILTSHALHKPQFLNIKSLPKSLKQEVVEHFSEFMQQLPDILETLDLPQEKKSVYLQSARDLLKSYVQFMNSEDSSSHFPEFQKYTEQIDTLRSQKWDWSMGRSLQENI